MSEAPIEEEKVLLADGALIEEEKVLLGSWMLDEAERMVLSSVALAKSWYTWGPLSWMELGQTRGHRYPMIEYFWSLPMHQTIVTKIKVLRVRYKIRKIIEI